MKTTVEIPDDLYGKVRKLAASRGQRVATLIAEGLQKLVVAGIPQRQPRNGRAGHVVLPAAAAHWLAEWRALSRRNPEKPAHSPSAAESVSRMRR